MNSATRVAYGEALVELSKTNPDVVVLDADLGAATNTNKFAAACPERYFDMGISEADMMATAAGFATAGKIPFASTFAVFAAGRAFDQVRNSIAYPKLNVKIGATHAGISVGADGGSHQAIEDMALMRALPNMTVICPSDDVEARAATFAAVEYEGPVYLRFSRYATKTFHADDYTFQIGKGEILREGKDVAIIACGLMVKQAWRRRGARRLWRRGPRGQHAHHQAARQRPRARLRPHLRQDRHLRGGVHHRRPRLRGLRAHLPHVPRARRARSA